MSQKNLRINIRIGLQQVQAAVGSLGRRFNLLRSSLRAVFRTGVVAGFFAALRSGMGVINNLQNMIKSLGAEFLQLRLKATETAAIVTKGGMGFAAAFEGALNMSRDLSTQIGFAAKEIQEGMVTAARSGLQLQDSLRVTDAAMQLATAHGEQFQTTLNNLIGVTRAFGVELAEIPVFADALTTAVTESNVSLSGLFDGLKAVASIAATAFGETRETIVDTTAALMTLNDAGVQGSKAGIRLRAAFQKLLGGTAKTTAAFTKYGVNLFQANAESQRFLQTLLNGQRAMANSEEKLNKLKNRQFELAIAGKETSDEFSKIQNELDGVTGKLSTLEGGLDNVFRQFTLAGGKLKPFSDILQEIGDKAPTEVIGRAFGIRGGEAIMRLLKDVNKFEKFKTSIEGYVEASQRGQSITTDMYARFLDTVLVGWMRIKNTAMAILGEIADGFFSAVQPLIGPIQSVLDDIFRGIRENKDSFKQIFVGVLEVIRPVLDRLQEWGHRFSIAMSDVFTPGKTATLPMVKTDEAGRLGIGLKEVSGSVGDKIRGLFQSLASAIVEPLGVALRSLSPAFTFLAQVFSDTLEASFRAKAKLWESIGLLIAGSLIKAFAAGMVKELPSILRGLGDLIKNLGMPKGIPLGMGLKIPLPTSKGLDVAANMLEGKVQKKPEDLKMGPLSGFGLLGAGLDMFLSAIKKAKDPGKEFVGTGDVTVKKVEPATDNFGTFLDKLLGAGKGAEETGKKVEQVGKAFIDFGDGLKEVNLDALNKSGSEMTQIFTDVERSSENFLRATEASNSKAERALENSERALRRAFQMNSKG